MSDIARKAGVSRATVSLVLNGKDASVGIAAETRERVRAAAEELGYRPNQVARAMVTGKNQVLVFLVTNTGAEVPARILSGLLHEAEAEGYFVKVLPYGGTDIRRAIERCVELRPTGVVALYVYDDAVGYLFDEMTRYRIPTALVDSSFPMERGIRVYSDDYAGMRQVFAHLTELGHRRIGFVAGSEGSGASHLREVAYLSLLDEFGLQHQERDLRRGFYRIEKIEEATRALVADPADRPTAVICVDDRTAMIVCRVAWEMGLRVPDDLSVVGFANLFPAEYGHPPLTTVTQPFEDMGRVAVRQLLVADATPELVNRTPVEQLLPTELVVRRSTAPPRE